MFVGDRRAVCSAGYYRTAFSSPRFRWNLAQRIKANLARARNMPKISGKRMTNSMQKQPRLPRPRRNRAHAWDMRGDSFWRSAFSLVDLVAGQSPRGNAFGKVDPSNPKRSGWAGTRAQIPASARNGSSVSTQKRLGPDHNALALAASTDVRQQGICPAFVVTF